MADLKNPSGVSSQQVEIGPKLRHLRRIKGMTLMDLANAIGCSESLLSKIENEKVRPSVRILHSLVEALDVNVAMLLQEDGAESDVALRPQERFRFGMNGDLHGDGLSMENLIPRPGSSLLQATLVTIQPGGESGGFIRHAGEEVGYVVEGQLELSLEGRVLTLGVGDSFHFRSDVPHQYRNPGGIVTRVVWVNTPPSF